MIHQYVRQIAGKAGTRGFTPNADHLKGLLHVGSLKATLVIAGLMAGLTI